MTRTAKSAKQIASALILASLLGIQGRPAEAAADDPQLYYSKWTKVCVQEQGAAACLTGREGRTDSGERSIAAVVVDTKGKSPILQIKLPLGMQLAHGTRVIIDAQPPQQSPYDNCDADGCVSEYQVSADFIKKLRSGKQLISQAINSNGKAVTLPIPLAEFSAAYDGRVDDVNDVARIQKDIEGKRPPLSYAMDPRIAQLPAPAADNRESRPSLIYSPWTKFCLKGQDANAKNVCFTGKDGRVESGQPLLAAVIIEVESETKKILRVTLPVGVKLVHGVRVIADRGAPLQSPYVICFKNGCMADFEATAAVIADLKKGGDLVVQAINGNGQPLSMTLPLAEFPQAYDGPPTDPKVFEATQKKLQEELQKRAAAAAKGVKTAPQSANNSPTVAATTTEVAAPPSAAPMASTGKRVALVVGNSTYRFMPTLQNPKNDATDVERTLKSLGFETVLATDLDRTGMNGAIERFSRIVVGADVAIVYYSGHGMQFNGKNYLLPIDVNLESAADVNRFRLMPVDDVVEVLGAAKGLQLIVLDACRNNPMERDFKNKVASVTGANRDAALSRGFSRIDARSGLVVTYATAPNDVAADGDGRNSPFTTAFLKHIVMPDLDVRQMLFRVQNDVYVSSGKKQLPEISSLYVGPDIRLKSSSK